MLFKMDIKRTNSATNLNRPLPPLPPSTSPPRSARERSYTPSLLSRKNSVSSEDTLYTASSSTNSSPQPKKRLWNRSNSFTFGRKNRRHSSSGRSSLADDATVVSFGDVDSLCETSSVEKSDSGESAKSPWEDPKDFPDLNRTVERYGMHYHPYDRYDASYMQSYSQTSLDSDYYTYRLLRRLNPNPNSPTFHDYGKRPPMNVLDLGSGEGHWVFFAAQTWRNAGTHVTGVDIIDVHNHFHGRVYRDRPPRPVPPNVKFVRANFTKYSLPFPDDSFDLVRMANLGLAVAVWTWDFVLHEVRRVLCPGGRLELIDDQLLFPRIPSPAELRGYKVDSPVGASFPHHVPGAQAPHQRSYSSGDRPQPLWEREYKTSGAMAKELETNFKWMIFKRGYAPEARPQNKLVHSITTVFGADPDDVISYEFSLGVPSRELVDDAPGQESARRPVSRPRRSESDVQRPLGSPSSRPSGSTPKALRVLVGNEASTESQAPIPYQPLGLIMLDSTRRLLPFSPVELEMHACKNMHVLLSCKDAMMEHMLQMKDEREKPMYTEEDVEDIMFEYDRFRRKRFNWPMDYPGFGLDDERGESSPRSPLLKFAPGSPPFRARDRSWSNSSLRKPRPEVDRTIEVRAIRVFHAVKQ